MLKRQAIIVLTATVLSAAAFAQSWPSKPIRLVVPFPAGGGTDIIARDLANKVSENTKWAFVIDNKPGSGGNIGIDNVAKSPADGYSLVLGQTSNLAINPSLYTKLPYDPAKDLTPISMVASSPLVIVVAPESPLKSMNDVVAAAKAKPGEVTFATSGNGTVAHLATELFQNQAGVKLMHVPYKGAAQGINDVMGGRVQMYVSSVPTLIGHIRNGKLRPLAVTSAKRTDDLPQTPTVAESGYKNFEAITWFGVLGPAGMPKDVSARLNDEINKALTSADLRKRLNDQGAEVAGSTAEQFANYIREETAKWGRVVKESGAKID